MLASDETLRQGCLLLVVAIALLKLLAKICDNLSLLLTHLWKHLLHLLHKREDLVFHEADESAALLEPACCDSGPCILVCLHHLGVIVVLSRFKV